MADNQTQVVSMDPIDPANPDTIVSTTSMTDDQKSAIAAQISDTGLFKIKTAYITIGDEPNGGKGVVNLKSMLSADDLDALTNYLTFMPRSMLWNFFMQKIWPGLPASSGAPMSAFSGMGSSWRYGERRPSFSLKKNRTMGAGAVLWTPPVVKSIYGDSHVQKPYETMVWAAFIDLFNEANLKYVNDNKIDPWGWEDEKTNAYYISTSKDAIDQLSQQLDDFKNVSLALDPQAKAIMEQYVTLLPLGDLGLEINRQNAVKELLKKQEYASAQAIIDAFRYVEKTRLGDTLTKPIPFNIVSEQGTVIAKAT